MPSPNSRPLIFAAIGVALALLWQWATVTVNYAGNWTALFETGALANVPASLAGENIYRFRDSSGFDGQAYHYIAHDPFLRHADLRAAVDEPRLRYRRILVPGLAWLLAAGQSRAVDPAYYVVCLLFIGLGVWWSCRLCRRLGLPPAFGLAFLLAPAVLVSMDRMVVDVALAALTVAFALYSEHAGWRLWFVLSAAALSRETGILLLAGYCLHLAIRASRKVASAAESSGPLRAPSLTEVRLSGEATGRNPIVRQASGWSEALRYALAGAPAAVWSLYVASRTAAFDYGERFTPLSSIVSMMLHPPSYPPGTPLASIVQSADVLALAGAPMAFALILYLIAMRRGAGAVSLAALCFALTGIFSQRPDQWGQVFDFGRVYTPLLLLLAVEAMRRRQFYWLAPWLMMTPRVLMQFAPQVAAVARALARVVQS